jgi:hypothetical protein
MSIWDPPLALEAVDDPVFPLTNQQIYHIEWGVPQH